MTSVKIDGSAVRRLREENELTQLYLATVVGVTTDTISRWENNKYPAIKLENAQKLAEALGVELEAIQEQRKVVSEEVQEEVIVDQLPAAEKKVFVSQRSLLFLVFFALLVSIAGALYFLIQKTREPFISAVRTLPSHTAPGLPFPVIIRLSADAPIDIPILLRETLTGKAEAWGIKTVQRENGQHFGSKPRWIGRLAGGNAAFLYMVHPGKELVSGDTLTITGDCISGKSEKNATGIKGTGSVRLAPFHWADTDKDSIITDNEILNAYELYSSPGNVEVDFHDLEMLWLAGGYGWDKKTMVFMPDTKGTPSQGE